MEKKAGEELLTRDDETIEAYGEGQIVFSCDQGIVVAEQLGVTLCPYFSLERHFVPWPVKDAALALSEGKS